MADKDPGNEFVRVTNQMIYDKVESALKDIGQFKADIDKRLTRVEVLFGTGALGTIGLVVMEVVRG